MSFPEESMDNNEGEAYLPGQPMEEGEELVYDKSAYILYHRAQTGSPCLSFDILCADGDSSNVEEFPLSMYMVCGTQSEKVGQNKVIVCKMSKINKNKQVDSDEESDSDSDDDDDDEENEENPEMETVFMKHLGTVNRIRCSGNISGRRLAASWSEKGKVYIWDMQQPLQALNDSRVMNEIAGKDLKPIFSFNGHQSEGYGLDWSSLVPGKLATGDCKKNIHIWKMNESGWTVDQRAFNDHTDSVEDIQWSPNEASVFSSCSVDKSIKIWDDRAPPNKACMITVENAHQSDVNVIHWNRKEPFIISGGDDGVLNVWDLREISSKPSPVATFKHHTGPITSVEWHPSEGSVFGATGADNQLTLWDLAVERDSNEKEPECPPQLLFIHQGQKEMKEMHWHPHLSGVVISTALSDFNIFKTISV
ncbi:DgyrCDS13134 [Dimorphilus gyrociliatus]|uniref:DgyrCDS13134 n=1 Tax=Dimorphilus gyrociliatus TaxID=2664684 RepID=A0A7I8W9U1_9ANNE|nr:DgyrCDS13134 [Dimorphilus gyrociliatus]